jgi:dTDP-D-glucose 4,6-dehydratase
MKELGWEPKVSIDERIKQVVQWTLDNERWLKS